jgi:D-alanyl-D-alanine carboxypeptidase
MSAPAANALELLKHRAVLAAIPTVVAGGAPSFLVRGVDEAGAWSAASGVTDITTWAPASPDAAFRIGSISKTFTAVAVLQLVDEGKIGLDRPVNTYLPGLLKRGDVITIRELLQHRSGLGTTTFPSDGTWIDGVQKACNTTYDPVAVVKAADLQLFEPGTNFNYANAGYTALELVIQKVTGKPYAQVLDERIVQPLHLTRTSFQDGRPVWPGVYVHGYLNQTNQVGNLQLIDETDCKISVFGAAGSGISTTSDLITFIRALTHGQLLPNGLYQQMIDGQPTPWGANVFYGLGIVREDVCGTTLLGNGGTVFGYQADIWTTIDDARTLSDAYSLFPGTNRMYSAINHLYVAEFCGR